MVQATQNVSTVGDNIVDTANAAQVSNPEFARDLRLVQAELDDVTDALLNLSARLHEAAGVIDDHVNRQSAVTKQETNL